MHLSPQTLARAATVALVVGAMAAMRLGSSGPAGEKEKVRVHPRPDDPLAADLLRCAELGRAAQNDGVCKRIWAENRERFLGINKSAPGKHQSRMTNSTPNQPRPPADRPKDE
jgi:conjugative transfer region protein TrbK